VDESSFNGCGMQSGWRRWKFGGAGPWYVDKTFDFVHAEARVHRVAAILTAKLSNEFFRLASSDFVAWFWFQFRLP
jgi:hypothetical protein